MVKQFCLIMIVVLTGCSSNQHSIKPTDINTTMISGEYLNNDGFGTNINLVLHDDGRYESSLDGLLGVSSYSVGEWSKIDDQISFFPEKDSGLLRTSLLPMTIFKNNNNVLLVPSIKVELHNQLMVDFGKSSYKYRRIQL